MSENINIVKPMTTGRAALNYGLIFGIILIIEFVIGYAFDFNAQQNGSLAVVNFLLNNIAFPFIFILLACNAFKKASGGYITFGQSIKTGVGVTVLASAVVGIFMVLFYFTVPDVWEQQFEMAKTKIVTDNPKMTSEQLKTTLEVTKFFMKPYIMLPMGMVLYALIGLILSLIVGAIVKKENPGSF